MLRLKAISKPMELDYQNTWKTTAIKLPCSMIFLSPALCTMHQRIPYKHYNYYNCSDYKRKKQLQNRSIHTFTNYNKNKHKLTLHQALSLNWSGHSLPFTSWWSLMTGTFRCLQCHRYKNGRAWPTNHLCHLCHQAVTD